MSTLLVGAVLLAITGFILFRLFAKKKRKSPGCISCEGCSGCAPR